MINRFFSSSLLACVCLAAMSETVKFNDLMYAEPIVVGNYVALGDTAGLDNVGDPLKLAVNIDALVFAYATPQSTDSEVAALNFAAADFENRKFTEAIFKVDSVNDYKLYIDGKAITGQSVKLHPGTHRLILKYVIDSKSDVVPDLSATTAKDGALTLVKDGKRMFTLADVMYGTRIRGVEVSPSGAYLLVRYTDTRDGGKASGYVRLYDVKGAKFLANMDQSAKWMPKSDRILVTRNDYEHGRHMVAIDPINFNETVICKNLAEGYCVLSPTEDFLVFTLTRDGKKEDSEIYRVVEPEDRQPGWRDRAYPAIYRFGSPVVVPLAIGNDNLSVADISDDGSKLLLISSERRMTKRPTTLFNLITLDIATNKADTIVAGDGFIAEAVFSPDASKVLVKGSPEAFSRVGCTLPDSVIPSAYDYQLYTVSLDDKSVKPLTRDFNPSVNSMMWNRYDGKIYLTATERDMYTAYVLNPSDGSIKQIDLPENVINGFDCAATSPLIAYYGQSDSNPDALYTYNLKTGKSVKIDSPSDDRLSDVRLGQCIDWTFTNPKGETVYARYYLPDNFDPTKKYPLIVNYYGGCTPSTRNFESRYPMHVYSSLGYVTLVIQPSGCTGFGQEWSSRHVSTAGQGVAEDIIAGTEQFCNEMDFIDADKIGCIGASYGGFMTQYLQTLTDMFAAAISHAGISDHTSYWGEGYWGYSYSEVSMGEDLPWTNPDLYVKQSPLYNADKIHTPILFLHGDADTNVPVGESIQMFTALKLLGVDTALVEVTGQNHHIMDDSKRKKWQDTIFAWFAKYLQDDPTWWDELYPPVK